MGFVGNEYRRKSRKILEGCGYQTVEKSFKIGLAILIQYRRVTDTHPASKPRCHSIYRAYYVARVKLILYNNVCNKNLKLTLTLSTLI